MTQIIFDDDYIDDELPPILPDLSKPKQEKLTKLAQEKADEAALAKLDLHLNNIKCDLNGYLHLRYRTPYPHIEHRYNTDIVRLRALRREELKIAKKLERGTIWKRIKIFLRIKKKKPIEKIVPVKAPLEDQISKKSKNYTTSETDDSENVNEVKKFLEFNEAKEAKKRKNLLIDDDEMADSVEVEIETKNLVETDPINQIEKYSKFGYQKPEAITTIDPDNKTMQLETIEDVEKHLKGNNEKDVDCCEKTNDNSIEKNVPKTIDMSMNEEKLIGPEIGFYDDNRPTTSKYNPIFHSTKRY